ncbi:MAG: enoyl-CoA hydratase/isomerase family protein [Alphaproteobacteria bacterium]|nr:enoyl-CoA hydratase/isomerase family protein [Alphaproteobacteria bacterium]
MSSELVVTRNGPVATLTLNRPEKLNALDLAQWDRLGDAVLGFESDATLRVIVIAGAGTAFAAGGDIEEFTRVRRTPAEARAYDVRVMRATRAMTGSPHAVIAAIRGACVGGGLEIACACDLRIAAESSRFGIPVARLGMAAPPEELPPMVQLLGIDGALELLLEARLYDTREALAKGLVTRVVPDDELDAEIAATAQRIAAGGALAARAHKRVVREWARAGSLSPAAIDQAYACIASDDFREGVAAFLAKRRPQFTGK